MLDGAARTCHYLSNLVLLFMQSKFDEELCKHGIDSLYGKVRISQLMLEIQAVPDVANCSIVLGDTTQDLLDKCDDGSWMYLLTCLHA